MRSLIQEFAETAGRPHRLVNLLSLKKLRLFFKARPSKKGTETQAPRLAPEAVRAEPSETETDPRAHAIASWRRMFTEGRIGSWTDMDRPTDFDFHLELLVRLLTVERGRPVSLLDVGSGPISMFSKNFSDIDTSVSAADTMADEYNTLLDELGIDTDRRLVRPVRAESETLTRDLAGQTFDLVVMRNALDHCQNPIASYDQLLRSTAPGGYLLIEQFENEAIAERWSGFHQWNIWFKDGSLWLRQREDDGVDLLRSSLARATIVHCWRSKRTSGKWWCGAMIRRDTEQMTERRR